MESAPALALAAPARSLTNWIGWAAVLGAALAMAATLPGRTHGLGLIEKPLVADPAFAPLTDAGFARMNLIATLVGSLFCFPCGWLIDRFGPFRVGCGVLVALGAAVLWMSRAGDQTALAIALMLTRGVGQSMLSVVSLAIIGKAFPEKPGAAMGAYAVVMTMLMAVSFGVTAMLVNDLGWRGAWGGLGVIVMACAPLLSMLSLGAGNLVVGEEQPAAKATSAEKPGYASATWQQALRTPCFWTFALSLAFFSLVSSGITLFQQRLLEARGQTVEVYQIAGVIGLVFGMVANLGGGWAAFHVPLSRILAVAMVVLAGAMIWLAQLTTPAEAFLFGAVYGIAGGLIMVAFFAVWGQAFGEAELARIQGIAQMLTVVGSSVGPEIVAQSNVALGSYQPVLWTFAGISLLLAIAALFTPVPCAAEGDWE